MKQSLIIGIICLFTMAGRTQNVGIGTTTPQSTLDVKGNHRFGGTSAYMSFDTLSGKMIWWNSYLFAPVSQTLMKHSAAADGLFYNNTAPVIGQLEYRNASGNPVFFTNFMSGNGYFKGRLGISAINPLTGLHVGDSSVLFAAPSSLPGSPANTPVSGAGNRMMWYADKASFRAGSVSASNWDKDNIGINSFASGFDTKANGTYSTATGYGTTASQGYSTAMGFFSTASGAASIAMGNQTTAKAFGSLSVGSLNDNTDNPDPLNINAADRIFQIGNGYGVSPGNAVTVLRNGNVGIGNTSPAAKLHMESSDGSAFPQLKIHQGNPGDYVRARLTNANTNTNNRYWDIAAYIDATASSNDRLNFYSNAGGDVISLTGNGKVGVGTGNPLSKMHIYNGSSGNSSPFSPLAVESNTHTYINLLSPNANESGILFGKADDAASGGIIYNNSSVPNGLQFRVNNNQAALTIDNNLNTSIGMSPTTSRLSVGQYLGNPNVIGLYKLAILGGYTYSWYIGFGVANRLYFTASNTQVAYVDENTGAWVTVSDMNLKKNVRPLSSVLPRLMQVKPVSYQMKTQNDDEITFGFLAQELQKVFPQAVKQFDTDKKKTLGISYTHLIPLAIAAIQEQQQIIDKQQVQIDELRRMVEKLLKQ